MDDRLDRLVNIDFGGRGIDGLYRAARERIGAPLALAAAERLANAPDGSTVLITTGSVSRAWISPTIGENDGPAGAAVIARALVLGKRMIPVILAEESLLAAMSGIFQVAGMSIVSLEEARRTSMPGGRLAVAVMRSYPIDDAAGQAQAGPLLDELGPSIVFSTERVGRNAKGIYHNMRGIDFGMGRSRIDYVFDEALRRGIPSIAVGDGGNEIGMGLVSDAVTKHVKFGDKCACGCGGGLGAVTPADVLMTAACSNWGCYAIAGLFARLLGDANLMHSAQREEDLLQRGMQLGLINSVDGLIDQNVDGISLECHKSVVSVIGELSSRYTI